MPVGVTGRMVLAGGVSAEGMRSARAASTWERIVAAVGIGEDIRLIFAYPVHGLSTAHCTNVRSFERNSMKLWKIKPPKTRTGQQ
jgi:hypothetical protein